MNNGYLSHLNVVPGISLQFGSGSILQTPENPSGWKWNEFRQVLCRWFTRARFTAFRYAWLLEQAAPPVMLTLGSSAPSLPVIIRPYNVNSNGMVVWAPKRMELFTTPPSSGTMHNWEKQLVVHELRHVAQMHRAGEHFFRVFGWLFGQQSEGISVGLYFPKWLLEGDAVITETVHSYAGRGREASFLMPYKAYFAENKSFSYDKWRYGSFRHQIPDHYALGYMKLSVARLFSGEEALVAFFRYHQISLLACNTSDFHEKITDFWSTYRRHRQEYTTSSGKVRPLKDRLTPVADHRPVHKLSSV